MAKPQAALLDRLTATLEAFEDKKSFVLVSPMDRWAKPMWNGTGFYIPPKDEVVRAVRKDQYESYKIDGKYVPGTLRVWDRIVESRLGPQKVYDVVRAIRESLGIRKTKNGYVYEKEWGMAGIGVVLDGASREEIEAVRAQGMERFKDYELAVAQMKVNAYESQTSVRLRNGLQPLPESQEVAQCRKVIAELDARQTKQLLSKFDLDPLHRSEVGKGTVIKEAAQVGT